MPTFPALNGQIKTPLRWYRTLLEQSRNTKPCRDIDCEYAILSTNDAMPPFQLWVPTSVTAITSWKLYDLNDTEIANITGQAGLLSLVPFASYNYLIYNGGVFSVQIPQQAMYAVILAGGQSYYSEVFKPLCPAAAPSYTGETGTITIDGDLYSADLAPDAPWSITRYAYLLSGMYSGGGAPSNPDWVFEGSQVANLTTGDLWRYIDGVWTSGRPPGEDYDLWYNEDAGTQHSFDGTNWLSASPPLIAAVATDYIGIFGRNYQPMAIGRRLDEVECFGRWVRFEFAVSVSLGTFHLEVWDGDGNVVAETEQFGTDAATATIDAFVGSSAYTIHVVAGTPDEICIMDVSGITTTCADDSLDCHMILNWTSCGNIGNTYYEEGFDQALILPSEAFIQTPEPNTQIEVEEDANQNRVETFRRTDIEYTVQLGYVPWHILDALTQVPLHDTITLTLARGLGTVPIKALRIEHDWDEVGAQCTAFVELKFQIDEAAINAACCGQFDPPCLTVCTTAIGFEDDATVYEEGQRYLMEDGTYATCTVADPVEFGSRTACPFRFARTENTTTGLLEYFYYNGTAWTPVMEINTLQPVSCDSDPVVYQLTGSVWVRFAAQLQWTSGQDAEGGGIEWYDLDEPFTNGELQAGIQFTAPAGALSIRFEVVVGDSCVIAESLAGILECECPPVEFPGPGGAVAGAIVLLGTGGIAMATTGEPIEAEYRVDGGAWTTVPTVETTTLGGVDVYVLATGAMGYTTIQFRVRPLLRDACEFTESIVYS
jgi:hypothetical protein